MSRKYPTWTARIPPDVKEYFEKKGYTAGKVFTEYYEILRQQEIPELLREKKELQERVRQIDDIVTHITLDCNTQEAICNTQKKEKVNNILKTAFKPELFIGKEIEGIPITKEMIDEIRGDGQNG